MAKEVKNIGASVRAGLLQLAKPNGRSFDLVLINFALSHPQTRPSGQRIGETCAAAGLFSGHSVGTICGRATYLGDPLSA